ncbi:FAD/NAD(P)-binding protein [Microbacterium sp. zg.B48]|uniref:FAD/NAD(P)-binding protein n=1 Tax=unclassified Microbacterium TaxID=2609290 RepID=UPI00214C3C34|nr:MULTISPECIES: FAD/NAD(P)-binding protein [unclassified Microbacterium]MCR2764156.1 FAD/NAD(P)-binding protein [Microbacterium sp. zg.B48]MCR2808977.1 FAD/NAD(P)-binding protein [Microbacterium sp. zg.B185]WIM18609.1 FAD/NAD(P)-binding protein [Microbacterium sp. zg-B185]
MAVSGARIAVIGASVRGTVLVERLLASAPELLDAPLRIEVFDPHPPGSGRIWRAGQRPELIMNTVASQSTVFCDETVRCAGPVRPGPTLAHWCEQVSGEPGLADLPEVVRAEAARTVAGTSPSRLLYGHYLRWCFAAIAQAAPPTIEVAVTAERVIDLVPTGSGFRIRTDAGPRGVVDAVILATGWLARDDGPRHPLIVPPDNPIDQDLSAIGAGETIAVRGLGMGFFDTVSLLTEGRGGSFAEQADGTLQYLPSGREPRILAGSGRGVPYRAKPLFGGVPGFPAQRVLRGALPALIARRPVDFTVDVLPLIERDALVDGYQTLARVRPQAVSDAAALLSAIASGEEIDALVAAHVPDPADRIDLAAAGEPLRAADPEDDIDAVIAEVVARDAVEAVAGLDSPLKAALHSYQAARSALIDLVAFGGLTPDSYAAYRRFLATAASFGSGPPLVRPRQLLALHRAGVVAFLGPGMRVDAGEDAVTVSGDRHPAVRVSALVEAWLPPQTVQRTADPLLGALRSRGLARPWRHADGSASDAVDIRAADGALVGADGTVLAGLHSIGVPHEDARVYTLIAPVPGTNSPVLREADAAARAALAHVAATRRAARAAPARTVRSAPADEEPAHA